MPTPSSTSAGGGAGSATSAGPAAPAECAAQALTGLDLRQRVGQLFIVGVPATTPLKGTTGPLESAKQAEVGGYLLSGDSHAGVQRIRRLTARMSVLLRQDDARPFAAVDQEGGEIQHLKGPGFSPIPSALDQGQMSPQALRIAWQTNWAADLRAAGVNLDFAPVADVVPASLGVANQPIGRYEREYGHTSAQVANDVVAVVHGLQGAGVLASAKHFPGLGRVRGNTDVSSGVTDPLTGPADPYLRPFAAAVDAGVGFVMVSTALYPRIDPDNLAVFSPEVMRLLRGDLGFTGVIVADDLGSAAQVSGVQPGERALRFVRAGGQVLIVVAATRAVRAMTEALRRTAGSDPDLRAAIDAAALAVLTAKARAGLLACRSA